MAMSTVAFSSPQVKPATSTFVHASTSPIASSTHGCHRNPPASLPSTAPRSGTRPSLVLRGSTARISPSTSPTPTTLKLLRVAVEIPPSLTKKSPPVGRTTKSWRDYTATTRSTSSTTRTPHPTFPREISGSTGVSEPTRATASASGPPSTSIAFLKIRAAMTATGTTR